MAKTHAICAVDGCGKKVVARKLCNKHYARWKRNGSTEAGHTERGEPLRWLKDHVDFSGDGCLIWPYARMRGGYGHLVVGKKFHPAHRLMCEFVRGPAPSPAHQAAHTCGKGHLGCVNPKHLRWATPVENAHDRIEHGTAAATRGENHSQTFLKETQVRQMRMMVASGIPQKDIAILLNISRQRVNEIVKRKAWKYAE